LDTAAFFPLADRWALPAPGGFAPVGRQSYGELALHIGALHFFNHADLYVSIPLAMVARSIDAQRELSLSHMAVVGAKVFPWALLPGSVRPYLAAAAMFRTVHIEGGSDAASSPGGRTDVVLPLGLGVAWRSPWHFIVDAQVQYVQDSASMASGVSARPLTEPRETYDLRWLDLSGMRVVVGVAVDYHVSGASAPGFNERVAQQMQRRIDNGSMSTFYVAAGPSAQIVKASSSYFDERRPYLQGRYSVGPFPHLNVGYYHYPIDAEVRLAYRGFSGSAAGYGVDLETRTDALFLEALKFVDVRYYGFVPFLGIGAGYSVSRVSDSAGGSTMSASRNQVVPSIVTGFDVRVNPATWWSLRTTLRWVPTTRVSIPGSGVAVDLGGLEFDFIQLVVYPERIWR
jgi:hypothetical protein